MSTEQIGLSVIFGLGGLAMCALVGWIAAIAWNDIRSGYEGPPPPPEEPKKESVVPYKIVPPTIEWPTRPVKATQAVRVKPEQPFDETYNPWLGYLDSKAHPEVREKLLRIRAMGDPGKWRKQA